MTPERFHRLRETLERRQPDLTVVVENVHKAHNFSAILRSCDAVGVLEAHAVVPSGSLRVSAGAAGGVRRWVGVRRWSTLDEAVPVLRAQGFQLVAAHPSDGAVDYRKADFKRPTAILLGQELDGLSERALDVSDLRIAIPVFGFVESLNVSVAAALILFEAQRQRFEAGFYDSVRLDESTFERKLFEWTHPRIATYCARRGLDYPPLDGDGRPVGWTRR